MSLLLTRLALVTAAVGAATAVAAIDTAKPALADGPKVTGGGSTFAALEITKWAGDVAREPYKLKIDYASLGSVAGRAGFANNTLDFGASDTPYVASDQSFGNTSARTAPGKFAYVPISSGGIGFMYNLKDADGNRVTNLKLTRKAVCKIFTNDTPDGSDIKWNDPDIVATNPQLANVDQPIKIVVRSDGSGTSYVFSEYCMTVQPDMWHRFVERIRPMAVGNDFDLLSGTPTSYWPQEHYDNRLLSAARADGVTNTVADPDSGLYAITYEAAAWAKQVGLPTPSVENGAGQFVQPDEENVTAALAYAQGRGDGTFILKYDGPDPTAYFPSTYTYAIVATTDFPADKGTVLARYLCYAATKGQEAAVPMRYARLSNVLVQLALAQIQKIPGAPPQSECAIASPGAANPYQPGGAGTQPGAGDGPDPSAGGGNEPAAGPQATGTQPGGNNAASDPTGTRSATSAATAAAATTSTVAAAVTTSPTTTIPCATTTTATTTATTAPLVTTTAAPDTTAAPTATSTTVPCATVEAASTASVAGGRSSGGVTASQSLQAKKTDSSAPDNRTVVVLLGVGALLVAIATFAYSTATRPG